jgi:CheY-like chemotaxis protein
MFGMVSRGEGSGKAHPSFTGMMASGHHRVLVVEDDRDLRESLVDWLQVRGMEARGVEHGQAAFQALRDGYPACAVLLDLDMPVMNGWTFMDIQREDARLSAIPVFVLTGMPDPEREARRVRAVAGLSKATPAGEQLLRLLAQHCLHH